MTIQYSTQFIPLIPQVFICIFKNVLINHTYHPTPNITRKTLKHLCRTKANILLPKFITYRERILEMHIQYKIKSYHFSSKTHPLHNTQPTRTLELSIDIFPHTSGWVTSPSARLPYHQFILYYSGSCKPLFLAYLLFLCTDSFSPLSVLMPTHGSVSTLA